MFERDSRSLGEKINEFNNEKKKMKISSTNQLSTQVSLSLFLVYIVLRLYTQYQLTWDEKARDQENNLHEYLAGESYLCQMFIRISKVKWFCQACSGPETMISLKLVDMCTIATKLSWFNILDKLCFKVGTSNKVGPVNTSPMFWARYKQISKLMLNFLYFCMGESDVWSFSELVLRIKLVFSIS